MHELFYDWIKKYHPDKSIITNQPLTTLGLTYGDRPDAISRITGQIWDLKPESHMFDLRLHSRDQAQMNRYLKKTRSLCTRLGVPADLVGAPTFIGYVYGMTGKEWAVWVFAGDLGFVYYHLDPTGRNRIHENLKRLFTTKPSHSYDPYLFPTSAWRFIFP